MNKNFYIALRRLIYETRLFENLAIACFVGGGLILLAVIICTAFGFYNFGNYFSLGWPTL